MRRFILGISFACASIYSSAWQVKPVTGTVKDSVSGQLLPSATIVETGTTHSTTTDANGKFTITPTKPSGSLRFTYLGYAHKVIPISEVKNDIQISLSPNNKTLNKVVVIGYGSSKRITH